MHWYIIFKGMSLNKNWTNVVKIFFFYNGKDSPKNPILTGVFCKDNWYGESFLMWHSKVQWNRITSDRWSLNTGVIDMKYSVKGN
jgi:hypothetical protein